MRKVLVGLGALALTLACSQALFATSINIADHSFETVFVPVNSWAMEAAPINVFDANGDGTIDSPTWYWAVPLNSSNFAWKFTGWDPSNTVSNWKGLHRNDGWYSGIDGNQYAYIGSGKNLGMYQDLAANFAANTKYTLTYALGMGNGDLNTSSKFTAVLSSFDGSVETVLASQVVQFTGTDRAMKDMSFSYTTGAPVAGNIRIRFTGGTDPLVYNQGDWEFDNVRLDASATPEPSSLMAMFGGLAGLGMVIRRKRS